MLRKKKSIFLNFKEVHFVRGDAYKFGGGACWKGVEGALRISHKLIR